MSSVNKDVNKPEIVGFGIAISIISGRLFIISHKKADTEANRYPLLVCLY